MAKISVGLQEKLYIGNLNAKRDWGHARDYVEGMWLMLQQDKPEDYVLATGITTTVRDFCFMAFSEVGISINWEGKGNQEKGIDASTGKVLVEVDPNYYRPTEVDLLIGDATKAKEQLNWQPKVNVSSLVKEMVASDVALFEKEIHIQKGGFKSINRHE